MIRIQEASAARLVTRENQGVAAYVFAVAALAGLHTFLSDEKYGSIASTAVFWIVFGWIFSILAMLALLTSREIRVDKEAGKLIYISAILLGRRKTSDEFPFQTISKVVVEKKTIESSKGSKIRKHSIEARILLSDGSSYPINLESSSGTGKEGLETAVIAAASKIADYAGVPYEEQETLEKLAV